MKRIILNVILGIMMIFLVGCDTQGNIKSDEYYNGTLICQHVAVSSWVTNLNIKIIDNTLFLESNEVGVLNQVDLSSSILNFEDLSFYNDYENEIKELESVDNGYYVNVNGNDFSSGYLLIENNNKLYLFFINELDKSSYEIFKGYILKNQVELRFTYYSGGCLYFSYQDEAKIGSTYDLSEAKSNLLVDAFIDLKTLIIYDDKIKVTESLDLIAYNDGVHSDYIIDYVFSNEDLTFNDGFYTLEELESYEYTQIEEEIIIIDHNITYTFDKSYQLSQCYYLKEIRSNNVLFNDLSKATNALDILYGSNNYESSGITIELSDNGYIIKLSEHFLAG